jgi:glycerol transport system substrate-binding protein
MIVKMKKSMLLGVALTVMFALAAGPAMADMAAAKKWVDEEFQPSTLSKKEQLKEMEWFIKAAKPFKGMNIKVVSETIPTHEYEAKTLAKAFEEITGIKVSFDLIQEGDVIEKLQTQWASGQNIYDAWINDSDLIGTHARYGYVVPLSDFMAGEGKDVTLPTLDVDDFMGKEFTTGPDGKLYQLPDQQFANLYWFRYDWFKRPDFKKQFKEIYGYELGVPVNWSAYEDIAEFFTEHVRKSTARPSSATTTTAKRHRTWAGALPMPGCPWPAPVTRAFPTANPWMNGASAWKAASRWGATVARGGAANGPAAKYALRKYMDWLRKYAPPGSLGMDFYTYLPFLANGNVAQQIFWYTAFLPRHGRTGTHGQRRRHPQMAHGPLAPWPLLGRGHEAGLPGLRFLDVHEKHAPGAPQGSLAVCAVLCGQDHVTEKGPCGVDPHPGQRYPPRILHRAGPQTGRSGGILPQPGPRRLDADRCQCPRLPETGPAVVAEYRRGGFR